MSSTPNHSSSSLSPSQHPELTDAALGAQSPASEKIPRRPGTLEELRKYFDHFSAFIEQAPVAMAMFDRNMRYLCVSDRWLELLGLKREEVVGAFHYEVFPHLSERWREIYRRCAVGASEKIEEDLFSRADGVEFWLRWELHAWTEPSGAYGGVTAMVEDITVRKRDEIARRLDEERFQSARLAAEIGMWEWNPTVGMSVLSQELHDMFGTSPLEADNSMKWLNRVYAEDRPRVEIEMEIASRTGVMEFEYRYQRPKRGLRYFYCKGRRLTPHGSLFGVVIDITQRRRDENALRDAHDALDVRVKERTVELDDALKELRHSEEQFRLLVEGVQDYAIFMLDPRGYILNWNLGAQRIKGYAPSEIIGKHFSTFYPEQDMRVNKPARELEIASKEGRYEEEGWRVRKDGSRFLAHVLITALFDKGELRGFAKVTRDITERRRAERTVRELSGRLLRIQDEERRRLARELHDSTGQLLSALALNLTVARQHESFKANNELNEVIAECAALTDQACREIRTLSYLLHPPLLDEAGLQHALRWYVEGFTQRTNIKVQLDIASHVERLAEEHELALFRIVQESLANIHRHSGSQTAEISLHRDFSHVTLEIRDHGKGIPKGVYTDDVDVPVTLGVGLRGMRERVRQLGGRLDITVAHPGTMLRAVLPL